MARKLSPAQEAERSLITSYRKDIWNKFVMGLKRYNMLDDGDRLAVCVSGGAGSVMMAKLIQHLQKYSDRSFEAEYICAVSDKNEEQSADIMRLSEIIGMQLQIFPFSHSEDSISVSDYKAYMENALMKKANELHCNKIAFADSFDDIIEFILSGMLYEAHIETKLPKLHDSEYDIDIIRPVCMVKEHDIVRWDNYCHSAGVEFADEISLIAASCEESSVNNFISRRSYIKDLISLFRRTNPNIENNIFKSVYNVNLRTIVGWSKGGKRFSFLDDYASDFPGCDDGEDSFDEIFEQVNGYVLKKDKNAPSKADARTDKR